MLPSREDTQQLAGSCTSMSLPASGRGRRCWRVSGEIDPRILRGESVLVRTPPPPGELGFLQRLAITRIGCAILCGTLPWKIAQGPEPQSGNLLTNARCARSTSICLQTLKRCDGPSFRSGPPTPGAPGATAQSDRPHPAARPAGRRPDGSHRLEIRAPSAQANPRCLRGAGMRCSVEEVMRPPCGCLGKRATSRSHCRMCVDPHADGPLQPHEP